MRHINREKIWDVIVIGTGIGGGTVGYEMARSGHSVLFLERGSASYLPSARALKGDFPEKYFSRNGALMEDGDLLRRAGRSIQKWVDVCGDKRYEFTPLLGAGVGGSSQLYGAAMERFFSMDFEATKNFSNCEGSSSMDWPIDASVFEPYYEKAERLYHVTGGGDPLRVQPQKNQMQLSPAGRFIYDLWQAKGLHPYRLPIAHKPYPEAHCPGCQATICGAGEKWGSLQACILPAIEKYGAEVLDECEVVELMADSRSVQAALCRHDNEIFLLKAKKFFLAAGAIESPALLLRSKSETWPEGLANRSRQVGKNLSRHFMDLCMVKLPKEVSLQPSSKELAMNDFYYFQGKKLGTVQSLGNTPHLESALHEMRSETFASMPYWLAKPYWSLVNTLGRPIVKAVLERHLAFALITDDVSYEENCVRLSSHGQIEIHYHLRPEAEARLKIFRDLVRESFQPYGVRFHEQAKNKERLAHASGTCRMGLDPEKSVVDQDNRAHGVDNLFVVDASFFPSGAGINPALTIAANALRVAEKVNSVKPVPES